LSVIRAFIAIDLSSEIHEKLEIISSKLKKRISSLPARWVPTRNIHLTVKFLGDVSTSNLELLKRLLQVESGKFSPFDISIGELGAYPTIHRPRVIWIGTKVPQVLIDFHRSIENETARLGYTREKRKYSPHLTLARVSRNANSNQVAKIGTLLGECKVGFIGAVRIKKVHLYRSDLKPGGAEYTKLYSALFMDQHTQ
jgi:2'-5' RNA ligase